jgi:hypothetical protein
MNVELKDLCIDNDLKELLRPLTQDEFERLEKSIVVEKGFIRDPLILWEFENKYYIVDGHNRYRIMKKYNYIEFDYIILEDKTKEQIKQWMIDNQLAKRNLTDKEKAVLVGLDYKNNKFNSVDYDHNDHNSYKTNADVIADKHGISSGTVRRNEKFVDALEEISKNVEDENFRNKVLTEEIKVSKKDIVDLSKEDKEFQKEVIDKIEKDEAKSIKEAREKTTKDYKDSRKKDETENSEKYIWFTDDFKNEIILKSKFQDVSNKFIQESFQLIFADIPRDDFKNFKNEISKMKSILKPSGFLVMKCSPEHIGELISKISKMKSMEYYYTYIEKREKKIYIENRRTESQYDYWIVFQKTPHKAIVETIDDVLKTPIETFIDKFTTQSGIILDSTGNIEGITNRRYIKCKQLS